MQINRKLSCSEHQVVQSRTCNVKLQEAEDWWLECMESQLTLRELDMQSKYREE